MPRHRLAGKALLVSAFFVAALNSHACEPGRIDERAFGAPVIDGDTIRLQDGRHVRFIGLNTPELGRDGRPPQPYAREAAGALRELLEPHQRQVLLRYGQEQHDRYGRTLAHPYLPGRDNITAELIRQGLATALVVPPNTHHLDCYQRAERQAREQRRGIWTLTRYRPIASSELARDTRGFRLVTGRVMRVGHGGRATWLNLEGRVAVKIADEDASYFRDMDFKDLKGQRVSARGWIYNHKGELRLRVRHPAALSILE